MLWNIFRLVKEPHFKGPNLCPWMSIVILKLYNLNKLRLLYIRKKSSKKNSAIPKDFSGYEEIIECLTSNFIGQTWKGTA